MAFDLAIEIENKPGALAEVAAAISDAGINLLHEFGPGIRQMLKGRAPKFVSRIEERINNDQTSREVVSFRQDNVVAVSPFHTARGSGTGAMPV